MNKCIRLSALLLAAALFLILYSGCGRQTSEETTTPAPVTVTGYILTHVKSGIISYSAEDFQAVGYLELRSDGTAQLTYAEQTEQLLYDADSMWNRETSTEKHNYRISGKVLTLEYYSETLTFLQK